MEGKKGRDKPFKRIIQIKTNRNGWTPVEFLGFAANGRLRIRFYSGETITRKCKRVKWYKPKRIIKPLKSFDAMVVEKDDSYYKNNYKRKKQKRKMVSKNRKNVNV